MSPTGSLTILQWSIDAVNEDEIAERKSGVNETNLSNPSILKKITGAGYLTFESAKTGDSKTNSSGDNTKKNDKTTRGCDYLTSDAKKVFNHLRHIFTQVSIL